MATLSGLWKLTGVAKFAGWDQRVVISGSDNADGAYVMVVGTVVSNVRGLDFNVRSQARNPGIGQWTDSSQIDLMSWDPVKGVVVTISADDATASPDGDFDDLVVECTSTDPELVPPAYNGPRLDLTIPEQNVRATGRAGTRRPRPRHRRRPVG